MPEETLAPRAWYPGPSGHMVDILAWQMQAEHRKSQSCPPSIWNLFLSKSSGLGIKRRASVGLGVTQPQPQGHCSSSYSRFPAAPVRPPPSAPACPLALLCGAYWALATTGHGGMRAG